MALGHDFKLRGWDGGLIDEVGDELQRAMAGGLELQTQNTERH